MDFFEAQERARRSSRTLTLLFILAVIAVVALTTLGLALALIITEQGAWLSSSIRHPPSTSFWHQPPFYLLTAAIMTAIILSGSLYKWISLQAGGSEIARRLGGTPVQPHTTDPDERRLLNVVEEMAIASGIPPPAVYVLDHEEGINAFAAGLSPSAATIGITRGALSTLTRDELQGVIAHEFSHVLNGDMRLNLRLVAFLHGLLIIALIGSSCLRLASDSSSRTRFRVGGRSSKDKSVLPVLLVGVTFWLIGYAGVLCGRLLKAAISREREFLADAAAVEFTRNPSGIAGALRKVAQAGANQQLNHPEAEEFTHMLFSGASSRWFTRLFSTHPPLSERLKRLLPQEDLVSGSQDSLEQPSQSLAMKDEEPLVQSLSAPSATVPFAAAPSALTHTMTVSSLIPLALLQALRQVPQAVEIIFQLIQGGGPSAQLDSVATRGAPGTEMLESTVREWSRQRTVLIPQVVHESFEAKVHLVMRAIPTLRTLHAPQRGEFIGALRTAIEADQQLSVFELGVFTLLAQSLDVPTSGQTLLDHVAAAELALGALALLGAKSRDEADQAFSAAWQRLHRQTTTFPPVPRGLPENSVVTFERMAAALTNLSDLGPGDRAAFMDASKALISADSHIKAREYQFFRLLGALLDVPVAARGKTDPAQISGM